MRKGVGPSWQGRIPLPTSKFIITGITRDETGVPTAGFTVYLMKMVNGIPTLMDTTISDANGVYEFSVALGDNYWIVDYKSGSPDKAGATVNTLVGN